MTYIFKYKIGKELVRHETAHISRFLYRVRLINWKRVLLAKVPVYLQIVYGHFKDIHNKLVRFQNEGDYYNQHDFLQALRAFREV